MKSEKCHRVPLEPTSVTYLAHWLAVVSIRGMVWLHLHVDTDTETQSLLSATTQLAAEQLCVQVERTVIKRPGNFAPLCSSPLTFLFAKKILLFFRAFVYYSSLRRSCASVLKWLMSSWKKEEEEEREDTDSYRVNKIQQKERKRKNRQFVIDFCPV